jgi:hypothetical protein
MRWISAVVMGLWWAGCAGTAPSAVDAARITVGPRSANPKPLLPQAPAQSPQLVPSRADHPTRWVGSLVVGVTACPPPLSGFTSVQFLPGTLVAPGLERFCVYESAVTFAAGPPAAAGAFQRLERDIMALVPSAPGIEQFLVDDYAALFLQQAKRLPASGGTVPLLNPRLAIIDSSPTVGPFGGSWMVVGRLPHGYTMANIARTLTCDISGDCVADVSTALALDLFLDTAGGVVRDTVNGGDFGSLGGLAASLAAEVDAWRRGPATPLILNLSLGWQPEYGGAPGAMGGWPVAVQLVHAALNDVACRGALSVAAAGNDTGGPSGRTGPLYPGGWEVLTLSAADCAARVGGAPSQFTALDGQPLLYAVGGVTEDGYELALSRDGSLPARAAYASKGTVPTALGYAPMMTGTSVGAVVVSAAAAAVWENRPLLNGHQVMALVTGSGAVGEPIDDWFCPGGVGPCGDSRVVDVCGAVKLACDASSTAWVGPCARTPSPVVCGAGAPLTPSLTVAQEAYVKARTPQIALNAVGPINLPVCGGAGTDVYGPLPWVTVPPCPQSQFYDVRVTPFVDPQPTRERCPPCFLNVTTGELYLEWAGGFPSLTSMSLTTTNAADADTVLGFNRMPTGTSVIYNVPPAVVAGAVTATVTSKSLTATYTTEVDVID